MRKDLILESVSLTPPTPVFCKEKIQDCTQMLKRTVLPAEDTAFRMQGFFRSQLCKTRVSIFIFMTPHFKPQKTLMELVSIRRWPLQCCGMASGQVSGGTGRPLMKARPGTSYLPVTALASNSTFPQHLQHLSVFTEARCLSKS